MPQYDFQITDYDRIFRKQYKIVLFTAVLGLIAAIMFAKTKVPVYKAVASVKVDRNSVMGMAGGSGDMMYGTWDNIETQTKVITSYPVLLRAAKSMKMVEQDVPEDAQPRDEKTLTFLEGLRGQIGTNISGTTNIISIEVTSGKPEYARDLSNAMAFAYRDFSMHYKKLNAMQTRLFIEKQLDQCRADLAGAEDSLRSFEERQKIPSLDQHTRYTIEQSEKLREQMDGLDDAIATVRYQERKLHEPFKLSEALARRDTAAGAAPDSAVASMQWVSEFTDQDPGIQQLNGRLIQLQIQLEDQRSYYKGEHPAMRDTRSKIAGTTREILAEYRKKLNSLMEKRKKLEIERGTVAYDMRLLPSSEMEYGRLMRKVKVKEELYSMLSGRHQEAMIAEAGVVDDVTIMSIATLPTGAINASTSRFALIGLFFGLIFGIIFAIIREMFDTSIGTIEDVERTLKLSVLAVIPHIHRDEQKRKKGHRGKQPPPPPLKPGDTGPLPLVPSLRSILVTHFDPKDPTAEAYRILRTNLGYLGFKKPLRTILMTSATMQEGKSTTIANLTIAFAQQGKKVLLMECNLRRPSLQRVFGLEQRPGVSDILIDKANWRDCIMTVTDLALGEFGMNEIMQVPGLDNFNFLPHGHRPPNPAELLSSDRMDTLLAELREEYDLILVDAPPVLPVADSIVLSTKVDGVVLVYKVGKAPRTSLRLCKERLEAVHANILGMILNDIRPEISGGMSYSSYIYTYGRDMKGKKLKKSRVREDKV